MDIQSNYPRGEFRHLTDADLRNLRQLAQAGLGFAVVYSSAVLLALIIPMVWFNPNQSARIVAWLGRTDLTILMMLGISACRWIKAAYEAVITIRPMDEQSQSGFSVALTSFLSFFLFFLPLSFTLDFLLAKSDPRDITPMVWYRPVSKFPLANAFLVCSLLSVVFSWVLLTNTVKSGFASQLPGLLLVCAVLLGARIAFVVNDNIAATIQTKN